MIKCRLNWKIWLFAPVAVAMLTLVEMLTSEATAPMRRMSRVGAQRNAGGRGAGFSTPRPDHR